MADFVQLNVAGLEQVVRNLEQLPQDVQRKVIKPAARKASRIISRQALANTRARTKSSSGWSHMAKNMTKREQTRRGAFVITIGPRWNDEHRQGHLIEHGTGERIRKKGPMKGQSTGKMPAFHPVEDAYKSKGNESVRVFEREMWEGIDREAAKLGRRSRVQ